METKNISQKGLTEITKKKGEVKDIAYERQKELTDQAIKLAEIGPLVQLAIERSFVPCGLSFWTLDWKVRLHDQI